MIGAGQAGLATSYWLSRHGVEHQLLERRPELGGAWQDRWDSFYLNTPNFSFLLPELTYDGPEPDAFLPRDEVIGLFRDYAARINAPVRLGTEVTRVGVGRRRLRGRDQSGPLAGTERGPRERRLPASRASRRPPPDFRGTSASCTATTTATRSSFPTAPCWWWAPGSPAGRSPRTCSTPAGTVHLSVSTCPEAPRRYRGQDVFHWILQLNLHGPDVRHQRPPGGPAPLPGRALYVQPADLRQRRRPQHPSAGPRPPGRPAARPV